MLEDHHPLFILHSGLVREAPGSQASTLKALDATGLSGTLTVADMGAGPGAATLLLAQALPGAEITAVDLHEPYLDVVRSRADAAGLSRQIATRVADMRTPGFAPRSLDLIWCEGALYFPGVEAGLKLWAPLLRAGGRIAFSDAIWLTNERPKEAQDFWMDYPEMSDRAGTFARIQAAGYRVIADFQLPASDWHQYFGPLGARAEALRPGADSALTEILDGAVEEATLFERYKENYGYAFFVVERA